MFEYVRTHNKIFFLILMPLVFVSFVFVGVQGYDRMNEGAGAEVARVDGQKITQAEWDAAHRRQVEQARSRMPNMDAKFFDSPEVKREALEQVVRDEVIRESSGLDEVARILFGDDAERRLKEYFET